MEEVAVCHPQKPQGSGKRSYLAHAERTRKHIAAPKPTKTPKFGGRMEAHKFPSCANNFVSYS